MIRWLIFLNADESVWLRLDDDVVTARGPGLPPSDREAGETIGVVPGTSVVLHWVELPALAPAQAQAAARLLAADVSGAPIAATHVALGDADADGLRPLALVDRTVMAGWLATLAAGGVVAERIVPLPLLLPIDGDDGVTMLADDGVDNVRGHRLAFAAEPGLAAMLLAGRKVETIDRAGLEAVLAAALATVPINLRQGEFAVARQWQVDRQRLRRAALMVAAAAVLWLAGDVAALFRTNVSADRAEQQLADAARAALPRGTAIDAPRAQVAARLASLGGDGQGFSALMAPVLNTMRDRPATTLQSLQYAPDTGLALVVGTPTADDGQAIDAALVAAGINATLGNPRDDGGTPVVDLVLRPR
jgi:general secretion pathway protein L